MAAGRNKLLRYTRFYLDGYDISGDARAVDSLDCMYTEVDMSGWNVTVRNYLSDQMLQVGVRGFQALLNDTASSGAFTLLKTHTSGHEISVLFGGGGEPDEGDPAYLIGGVQMNDPIGFDGGAAVISADFLPESGVTQGNPWGVILSDATSLSTSTEKAEVDNGAASTNGYQCNLHVTATSSGNYTLAIEHSTTGLWAGEEATLHTFTATGNAITSEHGSGTGTVRQYVRFVATRSGGSCTPVVTFARL